MILTQLERLETSRRRERVRLTVFAVYGSQAERLSAFADFSKRELNARCDGCVPINRALAVGDHNAPKGLKVRANGIGLRDDRDLV